MMPHAFLCASIAQGNCYGTCQLMFEFDGPQRCPSASSCVPVLDGHHGAPPTSRI